MRFGRSVGWAGLLIFMLVGPAALAHTGQRDDWGPHTYTNVAPNYDPIGTSDYNADVTGTHYIHPSNTSCPGTAATKVFRLRLMHERPFFPDELEGSHDWNCGNYVQKSYPTDDTGAFHVEIAKVTNIPNTWSATGHTNHP